MMVKPTYLVDGVALDDPAGRWALEASTRVPAPAPRRTEVLDLPLVDGAVAVPQGVGTGSVALTVAVWDPDGSHGGDLAVVDTRVSSLAALLSGASALTWVAGDGRRRATTVVEAAVSEPELRGTRAVSLTASLTTQPGWWSGTHLVSEHPLAGGRIALDALAGCTARLYDAVVRLGGPVTTASLTSPVDGTGVVLDRPLVAGEWVFVDTSPSSGLRAWSASSPTAWDGGTPRVLDYPAAGPLRVVPLLDGDPESMVPVLSVYATGAGAATLAVRSRRWYL